MARKKEALNPILITGIVIVGIIIFALAGLNSGWLKTQLVDLMPTPSPSPSQTPQPVAAAAVAPTISSITGYSAGSWISYLPVGGNSTTVRIDGTGFNNNSRIYRNGALVATTFVGAGRLTTVISAANRAVAQVYNYKVVNSVAAGDESQVVAFEIRNPVPTITTIVPASIPRVPANTPLNQGFITLNITGTGFNSQTQVTFNNAQIARTVVSSTVITVPFRPTTVGTYQFRVVNAPPGGGTSAATQVAVTVP